MNEKRKLNGRLACRGRRADEGIATPAIDPTTATAAAILGGHDATRLDDWTAARQLCEQGREPVQGMLQRVAKPRAVASKEDEAEKPGTSASKKLEAKHVVWQRQHQQQQRQQQSRRQQQ